MGGGTGGRLPRGADGLIRQDSPAYDGRHQEDRGRQVDVAAAGLPEPSERAGTLVPRQLLQKVASTCGGTPGLGAIRFCESCDLWFFHLIVGVFLRNFKIRQNGVLELRTHCCTAYFSRLARLLHG